MARLTHKKVIPVQAIMFALKMAAKQRRVWGLIS